MQTNPNRLRSFLLAVALVLFLAVLALSWTFHGTGIVRNDLQRKIFIPAELTMPLQVKAAYNGEKIFFRYRWPAKEPSIYHDMLKYEGGTWKRYGASVTGPQPEGMYEDRLSMMVDDGSIPEFARYGGYIMIGQGLRFFSDEAARDDVKQHAYLGKKKGLDELTKYLPQTRTDINDWRTVLPEEELAAQRKAGYFIDLWHWRAHRSNPIDKSDDQFVAESRYGDKGKGVFFTNWDAEKKQPRLMFEPAKNGGHVALSWDDLANRKLGFDDHYYMREDETQAYDPAYKWKEGDVLPRRVLRGGDGSHADISVTQKGGRWKDGYWDVTLERAMDTGNPEDDKIFRHHHSYTLAFAVHRHASGSRWHYVSLPVNMGLSHEGTFQAVRFQGEAPNWEKEWTNITLFYPGQVSWPMLNSSTHPGASYIKKGVPVGPRHNEVQLARYGVEMEFRDEIRRQWLYTLAAGVLLVIGLGFALVALFPRKESRP